MTEKKCGPRSALWAFALAGTIAIVTRAAFAAGNQPAVEPATTAVAPASSEAPKSDGAKTWDFDHDRGYLMPQDWTAVSGKWQVLIDPDAASQPNTLGLPGYGLPRTKQMMLWIDSFFTTHYLLAISNDSTAYSDFSYESAFKLWGGAWGSYAGLVFRYTDPQNYYVLRAAFPKDHLALYQMKGGHLDLIKEVTAALEFGRWYTLKIDAKGGNFTAYLDGKQMFEAHDDTIATGRIGVWSQNDSRASFDNIKLTPAPSA